jgi:histidine ammonia-lyase
LKEERVVYGMTTGFGASHDRIIPPEEAVTLQKNRVRSQACSAGEPLEKEVVRAIEHIRQAIPRVEEDRFMHPDIDLATAMIHRGEILLVAESVIGSLGF